MPKQHAAFLSGIVRKFPELSLLTIFNNCVSTKRPPLLLKAATLTPAERATNTMLNYRLPVWLYVMQAHISTLSLAETENVTENCRLSRPPVSCWHHGSDMACIRRSLWPWQECWELHIPTCQDSERRHLQIL